MKNLEPTIVLSLLGVMILSVIINIVLFGIPATLWSI
jgi:hypothetical protein